MVLGQDAWGLDQPDVQADLARGRAVAHATKAYTLMEQARGHVVTALNNPDLPATSRDRLQQLCASVGVLAYPQEVKP